MPPTWATRSLSSFMSHEDISSIDAAIRSLNMNSEDDLSLLRQALLSRFGINVADPRNLLDHLRGLDWTNVATELDDWDLTRPLTDRRRGETQQVGCRIDALTHRRMAEVVGSQTYPEYRTTSDFILSSIRHNLYRLAYLASRGVPSQLIRSMNAEIAQIAEENRAAQINRDMAMLQSWREQEDDLIAEVRRIDPNKAEDLMCDLISRATTMWYRRQVAEEVAPLLNDWLERVCSGSDRRTKCRVQALLDAQEIPLSAEEANAPQHMEV